MSSFSPAAVAPRVRLLVALVVTATAALVMTACAGWPDGGGTQPRSGGSGAPAPVASPAPTPGSGIARGAGVSGAAASAAPRNPACAAITHLYADLVAVELGLAADDGGAGARALAADTAARSSQVPPAVAHDLDVLAQIYGDAARALDRPDAGGEHPLDQAATAVTAPAATDATADLDRYLRAHCS